MSKWHKKFITIVEMDFKDVTRVFVVYAENSTKFLGNILFQDNAYSFFQFKNTFINSDCMDEILDFCNYLNKKTMSPCELLYKLSEVIKEYEQINFNTITCSINIWDEEEDMSYYWFDKSFKEE